MTEENAETFAGDWTGTGAISGSGDSETIDLDNGEYMISKTVHMGATRIAIQQNHYDPTGDDAPILQYRHGATQAACESAGWNNYTGEFDCLGYVQVRVENN